MKKVKLSNYILIVILLFTSLLHSQNQQCFNVFPQDSIFNIHITPCNDGYTILTGSRMTATKSNRDIVITKLKSNGEKLWTKYYGNKKDFYLPASIISTENNSFVILANYYDSISLINNYCSDLALIKFDNDGNLIWFNRYTKYGSELASTLKQNIDGTFALAGTSYDTSGVYSNTFIIKANKKGDIIWEKNYKHKLPEICNEMIITNDNGFIISGYSKDSTNQTKGFLLKADNTGNEQWQTNNSWNGHQTFGAVIQSKNGNYIYTTIDYNAEQLHYSYSINCIDSSQNLLWQKKFPFGYLINLPLIENSDGTFVTGGNYEIDNIHEIKKVVLLKLTSFGDTIWTRTYSLPNKLVSIGTLLPTKDNGFLFSGQRFDEYDYSFGSWVVKVDCMGADNIHYRFSNQSCDAPVVANENVITPLILKDDGNMYLYPNPANKELNISYSKLIVEEIKVINGMGECVFQRIPVNQQSPIITIDISNLKSGIYYIQTLTSDKILSNKFVRE